MPMFLLIHVCLYNKTGAAAYKALNWMDSPPYIELYKIRLRLDVCGEMEEKNMNVGMLISSEASMHLLRPHNRKRRSSS